MAAEWVADAEGNGECVDGEDWKRREASRIRQILIGKARPEYRRYVARVPPERRNPRLPSTPDPRARISKRQFDRVLGEWRRKLHAFDTSPWLISGSWLSEEGRYDVGAEQEGTSCIVRLHLAEQFPDWRPWTLNANGLELRVQACQEEPDPVDSVDEVGCIVDKLVNFVLPVDKQPEPEAPPQSRLAARTGPRPPVDKEGPPRQLREEQLFPEEWLFKEASDDDQGLHSGSAAAYSGGLGATPVVCEPSEQSSIPDLYDKAWDDDQGVRNGSATASSGGLGATPPSALCESTPQCAILDLRDKEEPVFAH